MADNSRSPDRLFRRGFLGAVGGAALATAVPGRVVAAPARRTYWGDAADLGAGTVRTFARTNPQGHPVALGVRLSRSALDGLSEEITELHLHLPDGVAETGFADSPFTFVGLDWNPSGHPGPMYMLPHFDVHFYLIDEEEVEAISPGVADYDIPSALMPRGYVTIDALGQPREIVPEMGEHLLDPSSPEFNGETFTHTFIWGAYDPDGDDVGELIFMEPMLTTAFLEDLDGPVRAPIGMPRAATQPGWYPSRYEVRYLDRYDEYEIVLMGFRRLPTA